MRLALFIETTISFDLLVLDFFVKNEGKFILEFFFGEIFEFYNLDRID